MGLAPPARVVDFTLVQVVAPILAPVAVLIYWPRVADSTLVLVAVLIPAPVADSTPVQAVELILGQVVELTPVQAVELILVRGEVAILVRGVTILTNGTARIHIASDLYRVPCRSSKKEGSGAPGFAGRTFFREVYHLGEG